MERLDASFSLQPGGPQRDRKRVEDDSDVSQKREADQGQPRLRQKGQKEQPTPQHSVVPALLSPISEHSLTRNGYKTHVTGQT